MEKCKKSSYQILCGWRWRYSEDKTGGIIENNVSEKGEEVIKKLKKRSHEEKLTIYQTDKTGIFVMVSLCNYEQKMTKHLAYDIIVTGNEIRKI